MSFLGLALTHARIAGRQRALWVVSILLTVLAATLNVNTGLAFETDDVADLAFLAQLLALLPPIAYAAAFTDLVSAPARLGIAEVEASSPTSPAMLAVARVIGSLLVVALPSALVLLFCGFAQTAHGNQWAVLQAVSLFAFVAAPGALLAMSLSSLAGTVLPRAIARIAAVAAWCVAIGLTTFVPTPEPGGGFKIHLASDAVCQAFFGCSPLMDQASANVAASAPIEAVVALAAKLAIAIALLLLAGALSRSRAYRRG